MASAKSNVLIAGAIVFAGLLVAGAIVVTQTGLLGPAKRPPDPFGGVREAVAKQLLDPHSAEFGGLRRTDTGYCGEVNGKDRTGLYAVFQRFFATRDGEGIWRITFEQPLIDVMCKAAG